MQVEREIYTCLPPVLSQKLCFPNKILCSLSGMKAYVRLVFRFLMFFLRQPMALKMHHMVSPLHPLLSSHWHVSDHMTIPTSRRNMSSSSKNPARKSNGSKYHSSPTLLWNIPACSKQLSASHAHLKTVSSDTTPRFQDNNNLTEVHSGWSHLFLWRPSRMFQTRSRRQLLSRTLCLRSDQHFVRIQS